MSSIDAAVQENATVSDFTQLYHVLLSGEVMWRPVVLCFSMSLSGRKANRSSVSLLSLSGVCP
jgi:hypothetical protein